MSGELNEMGLVKEELNRMRQGGGGELHEWRRRECRIIGGGRGESCTDWSGGNWELYRMGEVVGCRLDQVMVTYLAR